MTIYPNYGNNSGLTERCAISTFLLAQCGQMTRFDIQWGFITNSIKHLIQKRFSHSCIVQPNQWSDQMCLMPFFVFFPFGVTIKSLTWWRVHATYVHNIEADLLEKVVVSVLCKYSWRVNFDIKGISPMSHCELSVTWKLILCIYKPNW